MAARFEVPKMKMVRIDRGGGPCRRAGWCDNGIQSKLLQRKVDAVVGCRLIDVESIVVADASEELVEGRWRIKTLTLITS